MPAEALTLALAHYDRHVPFLDGSIQLNAGPRLQALDVGQSAIGAAGGDRHERMLRDGEFAIAEISLSSFLVAKDQNRPFTGIPVFPRRLFSQSNLWVNRSKGIASPRDLEGRRVALNSYQTTLSVLAKGDLAQDYGVDWKSITWVTNREETLDVALPPDVRLERIDPATSVTQAVLDGEVDALFLPHPTRTILENPERVGRLFPDPAAEEQAFFQRNGYYPIMHLVGIRDDVMAQHPELPLQLMDAFARARDVARHYYDDPNWSIMAWGRHYLERENVAFGGRDPWADGVAVNQKNLERFVGYSLDQGLISRRLSLEDLFHSSTLGT